MNERMGTSNRRLFPKKIWRQIYEAKHIGLTTSQDRFDGFGNVIIPSDMDRKKYIAMCYRQNQCMLITDYGDIMRDVRIPHHILQNLQFPDLDGERGSLVEWKRHSFSGVTTITSIHTSPGEYRTTNEGVYSDIRSNRIFTYSHITDINSGSSNLLMKSVDERGKMLIKCSGVGNAWMELLCDGQINLSADKSINLSVEDSIDIIIGSGINKIGTLSITNEGTFNYKDIHQNEISIKKDKVHIISKTIDLGTEVTNAGVLGNKLVDVLNELISNIMQIQVPTMMGPSGVPINNQNFAKVKEKLKEVLSDVVKLQ